MRGKTKTDFIKFRRKEQLRLARKDRNICLEVTRERSMQPVENEHRARLLKVWKIKETLSSCNHRGSRMRRKGRRDRNKSKGVDDVPPNTYREANFPRRLVSNNSQADCSCIIKVRRSWFRCWIHGRREGREKKKDTPGSPRQSKLNFLQSWRRRNFSKTIEREREREIELRQRNDK